MKKILAPLAIALIPLGSAAPGDPPGRPAIPFGPVLWSADEDSRWILPADAAVPGNAFYIGGPPSPEGRDAWRAAILEYRRAIREEIHGERTAEISFRGVRAWVRMREGPARALDLRPEEPFSIDIEARRLEGNGTLVLALDLLDRSTGRWRDWSTVFSTLTVPGDGAWHKLRWEGRLPRFDRDGTYAKLIFGFDGTHDPAQGKVEVRRFALEGPERAGEIGRQALGSAAGRRGLDRSIYDRPGLRWASGAFACHFTFLYDLSVLDPEAGAFAIDRFLDEGEREFGGYDALVLWQAYPRIGVDERNQFDFYRDLPGGLPGVRDLVRTIHRRGTKVFIDYNPWDTGTRREGVSDGEALARLVAEIEADGIFLDTMLGGGPDLRRAIDRSGREIVFEPEGSPPIEEIEICSASWAQWLPEVAGPGLLRLKWIEPRHLQHQIARWSGTHAREIENAFWNGSGILIWENIFGTWNPWSEEDRAAIRRALPILRAFREHFASDGWDPFVPTLVPGVHANRWPGPGGTVWTILNRTGRDVRGPVLRIPRSPGAACIDLWRGERILLREVPGGEGEVDIALGPMGAVAAIEDPRLLEEVLRWLPAQAGKGPRPGGSPVSAARSVIDARPVAPTEPAGAAAPPPGMVRVPAGIVTMRLRHQRRECGCYPDPGTPPGKERDILWGDPWNGTVDHAIGPIELGTFWIDEHEVTNGEYARFLRESGWKPRHPEKFLRHWGGDAPPPELADHPVVYVDLDDARAYARWAGKRLPTEAEWHRAAQGDDGRVWPWGNEYDPRRANGDAPGTAPVTAHPTGKSPFGCVDMAGNVWEWTESERSDGHTRFAMIRGGSYFRAKGSGWYVEGGAQPITSHTKFILLWPGLDRCATVGFRCVKDAEARDR